MVRIYAVWNCGGRSGALAPEHRPAHGAIWLARVPSSRASRCFSTSRTSSEWSQRASSTGWLAVPDEETSASRNPTTTGS